MGRLRSETEKASVLDVIRRRDKGEGVTASVIAEYAGRNLAAVRACLREMEADGRVVCVGVEASTVHRPPKLYRRAPVTAAAMQPHEVPTSADLAEGGA